MIQLSTDDKYINYTQKDKKMKKLGTSLKKKMINEKNVIEKKKKAIL